jgi:hypothetical protein
MTEEPPAKQPPTAEPPAIVEGPIPFKKEDIDKFATTVDASGSTPTGLRDCMKIGGHGGPKGDRFYFAGEKHINTYNTDTQRYETTIVPEKRICEICGTVDV